MFDGKAFGEDVVDFVKGFLAREVAPLKSENESLKARLETLEGRSSEPDDAAILRLVEQEVAKIPAPQNGKDADPEQVASLVAEQVKEAVAAIPAPQDGKSVGVEEVAPLVAEEVAKAVASLPRPEPDPSLEQQAALAGHFMRKELGDTALELPPLPVPDPQVNVQVDVHTPKRGVEETIVTERDDKGRVAKFERREVEG